VAVIVDAELHADNDYVPWEELMAQVGLCESLLD
jgi:hypothetical protein